MKTNLVFIIIITLGHVLSAQELNRNTIEKIIKQIPQIIETNYVDQKKGKQIAIKFKSEINSGKYYTIKHRDSLANRLSRDLKTISQDGHMYVLHLSQKYHSSETEGNWLDEEYAREINQNFGFTEVQILENNIGYVKIVSFMHPKRSMHTAIATMKFVENTTNLILDLRDNGGGYPGISEYIINHYFDGPPTLLTKIYYSDPLRSPDTKYTSDLVHGNLRIGKPLYILINQGTGSAAEYCAYTLQAFGKAIIVGENSHGSAHNNNYFSLSTDFKLSVSTAMPINEKTNSNWERTGVVPDVQVLSNNAKDKAIELISKLNN